MQVNDTKINPEHFFRGTKLYLEFTIVAGQQASRNFNVTGETVAKSSFFTTLRNDYSNDNGMYKKYFKKLLKNYSKEYFRNFISSIKRFEKA